MNDLISRQMAIDALSSIFAPTPTQKDMVGDCLEVIEKLPSVQPEQKNGHWINAYPDIEPNPMFMYGICSVCGFEQALSNKLNFCPNCGAKMDGETE